MIVAAIVLFVLVLDQLSKQWLMSLFDTRPSPIVLCEYFSLVMVWNRGVSFSMFTSSAGGMPYLLILMAVGISLILLHLAMRARYRSERAAYAMVVGGALGNAIDRARFGAVADFFYAHIGDLGWPAFNVADMAICCGVAILLFCAVKYPARA